VINLSGRHQSRRGSRRSCQNYRRCGADPRKRCPRDTKHKGKRKSWGKNVKLAEPTTLEQVSFDTIKAALSRPGILHFADPTRYLCIDVDVSALGIGVEVYHIDDKALPAISTNRTIHTYPPRTAVQPIAFLSRTLSDAERTYWSSEMEILGFVWVLRKCRHWVMAARKHPIYIFTDHKAIKELMRKPI
jgi:hypothetical protein